MTTEVFVPYKPHRLTLRQLFYQMVPRALLEIEVEKLLGKAT